jgi:hypothetical protein
VFVRTGTAWSQEAKLTGLDELADGSNGRQLHARKAPTDTACR